MIEERQLTAAPRMRGASGGYVLTRTGARRRLQAEPGPHHPAGDLCRAGGRLIALWRLLTARASITGRPGGRQYQFGLAGCCCCCSAVWASYRVVNVPAFADFLIAVEAEMNKVSWPTRGELFRASMVVLILIFALAFVLAGFDMFWKVLLFRLALGVA